MSPPGGLKEAVRRPASPLQTFRAVAWSFFGIRRAAEEERAGAAVCAAGCAASAGHALGHPLLTAHKQTPGRPKFA